METNINNVAVEERVYFSPYIVQTLSKGGMGNTLSEMFVRHGRWMNVNKQIVC